MDIHEEHGSSLDLKRIALYTKSARAYGTQVNNIIKTRDYARPESALAIASDTKYQKNIRTKIAHLMDAEHVILVGIGGSSLGTEAIYTALRHTIAKELTILDTLDERALSECIRRVRKTKRSESLAVVVVTKSGKTTETLMNASALIDAGTEQFGESFLKRVVFVGNADTAFMKAGKRKKILCLTMPDSIGGRYSVFTGVGVVPLMLLGIDTEAFLRGAENITQSEVSLRALTHAAHLAFLAESGDISSVNFFALDPQLARLGMWYRQLLAESIGKPLTTKKKPFTHQLLPFVSTTHDFHASLQLYLGGQSGTYTHFVSTLSQGDDTPVGKHWLLGDVMHLTTHSRETVMRALIHGVLASYRARALPYREVVLVGLTPYELGTYMATAMLEVMTLCHLFGIDGFGQPQVEEYKLLASKALSTDS